MRLRGRTQVDSSTNTVLDIDPTTEAYKPSRGRTTSRLKEPTLPSYSDEIEPSEEEDSENSEKESDNSDKPDTISDDSSNLDDEIPVATRVTGRAQGDQSHRKQRIRRKAGDRGAGRKGNDDIVEGGRTGAKKAAPANSLLKYLKPNVSNVADRPRASTAGSDSDDAFEAAPPSLQAGRRKRKVVAHPSGSKVRRPRTTAGSLDSSDEEIDDLTVKENLTNSRMITTTTRNSTRIPRQSRVRYKEASSEEEWDLPPGRSFTTVKNPHGSSEAKDDAKTDEGKDSPDLGALASHMAIGATKTKGTVEEIAPAGPLKCYLRQNKVQSEVKLDTKSSLDGGMHACAGERCSQRATRARNLKDASSSDEYEGDAEDTDAFCKVAAAPERKLRRLYRVSEWKQPCKKAVEEVDSGAQGSPQGHARKPSVAEKSYYEPPTILNVGVYGIEREKNDDTPLPISKRIGRVEKILSIWRNSSNSPAIFCVKEFNKSYRNVVNVKEELLLKHCPQLLRNFLERMDQLGRADGHSLDHKDSPAFDPLFTKIDRIIAQELQSKKKVYLVKWCRLPYAEATWEKEENLVRDQLAIFRYHQFNTKISRVGPAGSLSQKAFKDGRTLRDYQEAGVAWLHHNFENRTNCVLADEMGLGKTIQSVAMLETLRTKRKIRGPFLVIAPVSTLGHWQREVESLTDMNCVVYTGTQEDRDIIRQYEFYFPEGKTKLLKFNVLLTSFEMLMKDQNKFAKEAWQYIIVDEAHRLKSKDSKTTQSLRHLQVRKGGLLLLTGTPVQNNTKEIFSLLNLLDPEKFNSEEEFLENYGEIKDAEQIKDLQDNILRPRLLRRMKEDVEKSIPQKEETIVWVELAKDQRAFYKGIFENNIASLLKGSSSNNIPNLRNVAMELRKICNHPFLCDGLEANLIAKHDSSKGDSDISEKLLQQSSGKMILVDKLLPKLKESGRRVLIFSQFTIMLDLLEDYLVLKGYSYERIDGKVRGSERQAAIDRYSAKDSNIFAFLLSTRAGGLGITLTAADTCIIYDSDWNPQNDLQAMARCHRIGQTKDVKIYRLITRNTYEQRLFECSSRKYGLDEAILGNRLGADSNMDHDKNIESLLKYGAYDIMKDDGEEAAAEFTAQDIDQILEQRTQQRQIGGRGNNTFSVATFKTNPDAELEWAQENNLGPEQESKEFWQELMPEACERAVVEAMAAEVPEASHPGGLRNRTRGRVDYRENAQAHCQSSSDELEEPGKSRKRGQMRDGSSPVELENCEEDEDEINHWSEKEIKRLEDRLFALGRGRTEQIRVEARLEHHSLEEIEDVSEALIELCQSHVNASKSSTAARENRISGAAVPIVTAGRDQTSLLEAPTSPSSIRDRDAQILLPFDRDSKQLREELEGIGLDGKTQRPRVSSEDEMVSPVQDGHPSGNLVVMLELGSPQLKPKPVVLPAVLERVMESSACKERIQRNASRYLQQLHERKVLAEALQMRALDFMHMPIRSKKLPSWWGKQEDEDLLRAAHEYGHKDFKRIKSDSNLSFIKRFATPTSHCVDAQVSPKDESPGEEGQEKETFPSDQVLGSRLKKLIESLPNGLSTFAVSKRAIRAEASRRSKAGHRKLLGKLSPDETQKAKPEKTEKSLAQWVPSPPKNTPEGIEEARKDSTIEDKVTEFKVPAPRKRKAAKAMATPITPTVWTTPMSPCSSFEDTRLPRHDTAKDLPAATARRPKKPLSQSNQSNVVTKRGDAGEEKIVGSKNLPPKAQQKRSTESAAAPKRKKMSRSLPSAAGKRQKEGDGRQTSMKSFLKANLPS